MLQSVIRKIVDSGVQYGIFTDEERELHTFSLLIMFEQVTVWVSIFILAFVGKRFWETAVLMLFYVPLRVYAGGFHARTFTGCYFLSVGVYATMLLASQYLSSVTLVLWIATVVAITVICIKSPLADPNKPMQPGDYEHYRKMIFSILPVELCAFVGFIVWGNVQFVLFIIFSFIQLAALLLLSSISHSKESK